MKTIAAGVVVGLAALVGCGSSPSRAPEADATGNGAISAAPTATNPPSVASAGKAAPGSADSVARSVGSDDQPVAMVKGRVIKMNQLVEPLMKSHGLDTLLVLVQLELAKQAAEEKQQTVVPVDIQAERDRTLAELFNGLDEQFDDKISTAEKAGRADEVLRLQHDKTASREQFFDKYLAERRMTNDEFNLLMETKAYLRKAVEPRLEGKITEEMLQKEFAARYGEKVRVRHIELSRLQDAGEVKRRLAAGQTFEEVARTLSKNRATAALGGEVRPFSRDSAQFSQSFKDVAFALQKPGDISEPVLADDSYHIIQLIERIPPSKAVKYGSVRDIIERDVHAAYVALLSKQLEANIAEYVRGGGLKIDNEILAKQFAQKLAQFQTQQVSKENARDEMTKERERKAEERQFIDKAAATRAASQPSFGQPATLPSTQPAKTSVGAVTPPVTTIEQRIQSIRATTRRTTQPAAPAAAATTPAGPATRPAGAPLTGP